MLKGQRKKDPGEAELLRWIAARTRLDPARFPIGPGDDAALVNAPQRRLVVTVDTIAEGVDFKLESATAHQVGRKAVAVCLSDLAAMGAEPLCLVASAVLTRGLGGSFVKGLYKGMESAAARFDCPLVGGDLTSWAGDVVITVTALGTPVAAKAVTRSGARAGDAVFVTGSLGGSIRGKHLRFVPRLAESAWLVERFAPTAMIDISDGLGVDAGHIASESGCRICIEAARVPVSRAAHQMAAEGGACALTRAVGDGEDFELLFTLPTIKADKCIRCWPFKTRLSLVGEAVEGEGAVLRHADGKEEPIDSEGYQHF